MGKKNLYALLGGLLLTACSGSGAGDALQDYLDAMQNKDLSLIHISEPTRH